MAFRVGGMSGPVGPPAEEAPMDPMGQMEASSEPAVMPEEPMGDMPLEQQLGEGTVQKELAFYRGPERIEMACGSCIHFSEPGTCEIVAGGVDPAGTCNLFVQDSGGEEVVPEETDLSEPVETDTAY